MQVMVVGQIARDLVLRIPDVPGPLNTAPVRARLEMLGGKGANQAVGLAQLGVPVALLGVVGDDDVGRRLLDQARSDGVDTSPVIRRSETETALVVDLVDGHGRWRYLEHLPRATLLTEADVRSAADGLAAATAVLVQLQQPATTAVAAAHRARDAGARVLLDGAPDDAEQRDALLAAADIVRANAEEAVALARTPIPDAAAAVRVGRDLLRRGPSLVALEVAGEGNVFVWPDGKAVMPLADTPVVDTTGAGDALVAGLVGALLRGDEVRQAARFAVAAAAATVGHPGGRPDLSAEAIGEHLAKLP